MWLAPQTEIMTAAAASTARAGCCLTHIKHFEVLADVFLFDFFCFVAIMFMIALVEEVFR